MNIIRYMLLTGRLPRFDTIVHVGAHHGQEAFRYQGWGARRVVWFEAVPTIHAILIANLARTSKVERNWWQRLLAGTAQTEHVTSQALLADVEGEIFRFHLFNNGGASNSIFELSENGGNVFPGLAETGEMIELKSRRLDDELQRIGVSASSVDALVIDVQGAELKVLKGAPETLKHVKLLELEVSSEEIYTGGVLVGELDAWLLEQGFKRRTRMRRSHMNAIYERDH